MALPVVCVEKYCIKLKVGLKVVLFCPPCDSSWNGEKDKTSAPCDHLV